MPVCHKHDNGVVYGEGCQCSECAKQQPTAADLDAVAEEQQVKEQTEGK